MTREEEIIQAADECYPTWEEHNAGFYQGAKWADKHPREGLWDSKKVIMWLRSNVDNYARYNVKTDECSVDDFEDDLLKAMEE